jgi:ribonuclease M5
VEHASKEDLQQALSKVTSNFEIEEDFDITQSDLIRLGLLLKDDSKQRREYLGQQLRIGYSNGKQILNRLKLFGINLATLEAAMQDYHKH